MIWHIHCFVDEPHWGVAYVEGDTEDEAKERLQARLAEPRDQYY